VTLLIAFGTEVSIIGSAEETAVVGAGLGLRRGVAGDIVLLRSHVFGSIDYVLFCFSNGNMCREIVENCGIYIDRSFLANARKDCYLYFN